MAAITGSRLARWAWRPRIATRALGADPGSVRTARDFTVTTRHQRGMAERSPDIAIVVPELMTNALRHALPGSGDTRPRQPIRLGLLQPGPCVLCPVADPARPLRRRERPAPSTRPAADCISSARSATSGSAPRPARRKGRVGPVLPAAPVPEQTRPRPVAEPGSRAEPASVNGPSPAVCRTDIGRWPVTSSTGHVWITIWCRYRRDRLPDLPAGHQATRICAGKWPTGRPGADPGTPPGVAPPSWVLAQFIHKLVHSPLHS